MKIELTRDIFEYLLKDDKHFTAEGKWELYNYLDEVYYSNESFNCTWELTHNYCEFKDMPALIDDNLFLREKLEIAGIDFTDVERVEELIRDYTTLINLPSGGYILYTEF